VTKVHGPGRKYALNAWVRTGGVAVTTYETTGYFKLEDDFKFTMLVVDEAHYIKNPNAARSKNVKRISEHADRMLFMTGTALENKVDEMIALIDILRPEIASSVRSRAFMATAPQFRERVAPVYYRRKREQVLTELPELIENNEWCTMTPQEEEIYEKTVLSKNFMAIRRVSWNVDDLKYSSKAKRLLEIVEDAKDDDRKVIVFSYFLDTIEAVCELLSPICMNPINGALTPQRRQEIIDEFDNAPSGTVLPAQIQSGGTGLNIQSASVVVICEPQYKPSIENQAISRAYRMGQARNVLVYRLLCEDSVDERMLTILEKKQAEFDAFADKSVAAKESIELDDKSFGDIIKEEINRINVKNGSKY
jgi:SNF2 family DNA or RNA helicase